MSGARLRSPVLQPKEQKTPKEQNGARSVLYVHIEEKKKKREGGKPSQDDSLPPRISTPVQACALPSVSIFNNSSLKGPRPHLNPV